jgi:hypothetical protein
LGKKLVIKQQMLINFFGAGYSATNASYSNFFGQSAGQEMQQVLIIQISFGLCWFGQQCLILKFHWNSSWL